MKQYNIKVISGLLCMTMLFVISCPKIKADNQSGVPSLDNIRNSILDIVDESTNLQKVTTVYNIQGFKTAIKKSYPNMTDKELAKTILLNTGKPEKIIEKLPDKTLLEALSAINVKTSVEYVKVDSKGNQTILSATDCMKQIKQIKQIEQNKQKSRASSTINNKIKFSYDFPPTTSNDGYMKLTTTVTQLPDQEPDHHLYILSGEYDWLMLPWTRGEGWIDEFCLASQANYDSDHQDDNFAYSFWHVKQSVWHYHADKYVAPTTTEWNVDNTNLSKEYPGYGIGYYTSLPTEDLRDFNTDMGYIKTEISSLTIYGQYRVSRQKIDGDWNAQIAYAHSFVSYTPSVSLGYPYSCSITFSAENKINKYCSSPILVKYNVYYNYK